MRFRRTVAQGILAILLSCASIEACGTPDRPAFVPEPAPLTTADAAQPVAPVAAATEDRADADAGGPPVVEAAVAAPADFDAGAFLASPATADVFIVLNEAAMRTHPIAKGAGPILARIPVLSELASSSIDPIRDTDWTMTWGRSLTHVEQGIVVVQPKVDDPAIDRAVAAAAKTHPSGGAFDAGVSGVKATLGTTSGTERVFLRPQPKLLVAVHRAHATAAADEFKKRRPKDPNPKEAARVVVKRPGALFGPKPKLADVTEMRAVLVLKDADGTADARVEADCPDPTKAAAAVTELNEALKNMNSIGVRIVSRGILNHATFAVEGNRAVLKLAASKDQLEGILNSMFALLGVQKP